MAQSWSKQNDMKQTLKEKNEISHFDKHASEYDANYHYVEPFTKYKINKKFNDLVDFIKENHGKKSIKILEIGCGTGEYTKKVAERFPNSKIIALDISSEILKIGIKKCKSLKNTSFICESAYNTKLPDESCDMIIGYYILHHIDISKFVKEAKRVLKPGGTIFFCEPNILNPVVYIIKSTKWIKKIIGDSPDEWAINPLTVAEELKGFKVVKISTSEFVWPIKSVSLKVMVAIDKITAYFKMVPVLKFFGGSVELIFKKR